MSKSNVTSTANLYFCVCNYLIWDYASESTKNASASTIYISHHVKANIQVLYNVPNQFELVCFCKRASVSVIASMCMFCTLCVLGCVSCAPGSQRVCVCAFACTCVSVRTCAHSCTTTAMNLCSAWRLCAARATNTSNVVIFLGQKIKQGLIERRATSNLPVIAFL